jgi:hypothetical protein
VVPQKLLADGFAFAEQTVQDAMIRLVYPK